MMMRRRKMVFPLFLLILAAMACGLPFIGLTDQTTPVPAPATSAPAVSPTPSASLDIPALTEAQLKNFTYFAPQYQKTVQLTDGKFQAGSGADIFLAALQPEMAFGDLNGDGAQDAAVLLAENGGGSGIFVSLLAMLNQGGLPIQKASAFIDDRPKINSLTIMDGRIVLEALIHSATDPMVSPTFAVTETYSLVGERLALARFSSRTPGGLERAVTISSPVDGSQVSGQVRLVGTVTVSPFENNLVYRILDEQGNQLAEGPFSVESDGVGGPGTFDHSIDLSSFSSGSRLRISLSDLSAKDGSLVMMDSVKLMIK
jgi:hypothetical protein